MEKTVKQHMPRARHEELLVHELTDEVLIYDLTRHKAHSLNKTAALVWQHCDGKSDVNDIARILEEELGTVIAEDVVWLALRQLERAGLLGERSSQAPGSVTVSRRQLLQSVGLGAVASLPLIVSIFAPTSAQAQSAGCQPAGAPCASHSECCPGLQCIGPAPKRCG